MPPSRRHSSVAPASPVKAKVAEVEFVAPEGPEEIAGAAGAVVSIVQVRVAAGPTFPTPSFARTSKVWAPAVRPV